MQRQHTGRPGTVVVPEGWSAAHGTVIAKTLTSQCSIRHPGTSGTGPIDQGTGVRPGTANAPHWTGPCEVWPFSDSEKAAMAGDEEITVVDHGVKIPTDAAPSARVNDIVTVTGIGDFVVASIPDASRSFSRVLLCTRHQP